MDTHENTARPDSPGSTPARSILTRPIARVHSEWLMLAVALFLTLFTNFAFFSHAQAVYHHMDLRDTMFLLSLAVFATALLMLLLSLVCFRYTTKPVLIVLLIVSSVIAYFMDEYNVVIDPDMVVNALSTDVAETLDLLSPRLFLYLLLLGLLPSILVLKVDTIRRSWYGEVLANVRTLLVSVCILALVIFSMSDFYSSFFREEKQLRGYLNPLNYIYAVGKLARQEVTSGKRELVTIAEDAVMTEPHEAHELIIMVVGETARADRFSLNGYQRETNPALAQKRVVSFTHTTSCGTSTAISVPCMFSMQGSDDFDKSEASHTENALDVASRLGVEVLWLDNNSSSKGVASRIGEVDYKTSDNNPVCDIECRDIGMLAAIPEYIDAHPHEDIFIVLHQMGNHGPAYYKRYPPEFEKFTPVCRTNHLEECSKIELDNTYDNAILYTDHFLAQVITLLEEYDLDDHYEPAMLYISDHGESLGENDLYLHGYPTMFAPDEQRHVPLIVWLGKNYQEMTYEELVPRKDEPLNHDNIFHTILGMLEIETDVYDASKNILHSDE